MHDLLKNSRNWLRFSSYKGQSSLSPADIILTAPSFSFFTTLIFLLLSKVIFKSFFSSWRTVQERLLLQIDTTMSGGEV